MALRMDEGMGLLYVFLFITQSYWQEMFVDFLQRAHNKNRGKKANYFLDERSFLK